MSTAEMLLPVTEPFAPCAVLRVLKSGPGTVFIAGPLSSEQLKYYTLCEGLNKFRKPADQHLALLDIASLPEGLVFAAICKDTVIGYLTFHYPEFERWAQSGLPYLLELGVIEVSRHWRGIGIGNSLLEAAFANNRFENNIVISMECYWSWDLKNTNLGIWEYREMMKKILGLQGFETRPTDDPDIISHPANILQARVGSRVSETDILRFEVLLFRNKCML